MGQRYQGSQRGLQERFGTEALAARLSEGTTDTIGEAHARFIEARDMFFIATADANGQPQCSYKGGDPGFVQVLDERTIAFPVYDGNGMFLTTGNLLDNPQIGLLFVDWETGTRLRCNGTASVDDEDPLLASYPGAILVVRVTATAVFANCRRYVHTRQEQERSAFVPTAEQAAPVPDWKRHPWFDGTLPEHDPALDPANPSAPSIPVF
jgi:predicted pyridoxine 5'-phosphate oxidase superfamily flavin-nucleotide-binding protein